MDQRSKNESGNAIQGFWVALGSVSSFGLAIVTAAILSRYLSKTEYGTYRQVIYVYTSLLFVFSAGLPKVYSYFLPKFSKEEGKAIANKLTLLLFCLGCLFSIGLYFGSGVISYLLNNDQLDSALQIFSPVPAFLLPSLGLEGIFSTYRKTHLIAIFNSITRLIMLLLIVIPVIFIDQNYNYAIFGWIFGSLFTFILAIFFKNIPYRNIENIDSTISVKKIFSYSLPIMVASIWGIAIKTADQFFISRYFGPEIFAEFTNGFMELPFVTIITSSTAVVLMPLFSKSFSDNNKIESIIYTWKNTFRKSAVLIYPMVVFCFAFSEDIMTILYSDAYKESAIYFKIKLIFNLFNIVMFAPLFFANGKTRLYAKVHFVLALCIWILHYLGLLIFNTPYVIAFNSLLVSLLKIIIFFYLSARMIGISVDHLFPYKILFNLLIHNIPIAITLKFALESFFCELDIFLKICIALLLHMVIILTTGQIFKIPYLDAIKPFVNRLLIKSMKPKIQ